MSIGEDKKAHCEKCQREYSKQNMLQILHYGKATCRWLCLKCHNLAIKEAA